MSRLTNETDDNHVEGIVIVSKDAEKSLNPRQIESYRAHRRALVEWLLNLGKGRDLRDEAPRPRFIEALSRAGIDS